MPSTEGAARLDDARRASGAMWLTNERYALHIGVIAGTVGRIVLSLAGLAPGALMISGVALWRTRTRRRSPGASRDAGAGAAASRDRPHRCVVAASRAGLSGRGTPTGGGTGSPA